MRTLIVISSEKAGPALCGLASALGRANHPFDCFVTGRGVAVLNDEQCVEQLSKAERAVVCEKSWAGAASEGLKLRPAPLHPAPELPGPDQPRVHERRLLRAPGPEIVGLRHEVAEQSGIGDLLVSFPGRGLTLQILQVIIVFGCLPIPDLWLLQYVIRGRKTEIGRAHV